VVQFQKLNLRRSCSRQSPKAIDAIAIYCQFKEGETCRLPRHKRFENNVVELECLSNYPSESETTESKSQSDSPLEAALQSIMKDHRPLFCFICLGQKELDMMKRVQQFASHGDVSKHIKRKHLQNLTTSTLRLAQKSRAIYAIESLKLCTSSAMQLAFTRL